MDATWLPKEVRFRLAEQQKNRVNRDGELVITAQEHRTQHRNRVECLGKVEQVVAAAFVEPKTRKQYETISKKGKAKRRDAKRFKSKVKENRGKVNKGDY
jgi:ribosome-associated protein